MSEQSGQNTIPGFQRAAVWWWTLRSLWWNNFSTLIEKLVSPKSSNSLNQDVYKTGMQISLVKFIKLFKLFKTFVINTT